MFLQKNAMKTLVIGASTKPERYSFKAISMLREYAHDVVAIGAREGIVVDVPFTEELEAFSDIHTVTLYINPTIQKSYFDYILSLKPKRIIFNPGTENKAFYEILLKTEIEIVEACTLVLLRTNQFE